MSCTLVSPSCESRRRETASYSYRPCIALVVDLMCHSKSGRPIAFAISMASMVLPVPGSPLTSSGRSRVSAAFTAIIRSSVAMYVSVPSNRFMASAYQLWRRQVALAVDVVENARIIALDQLDGAPVPLQHRARALVALEGEELLAQCGAKSHGVAALSLADGSGDQG